MGSENFNRLNAEYEANYSRDKDIYVATNSNFIPFFIAGFLILLVITWIVQISANEDPWAPITPIENLVNHYIIPGVILVAFLSAFIGVLLFFHKKFKAKWNLTERIRNAPDAVRYGCAVIESDSAVMHANHTCTYVLYRIYCVKNGAAVYDMFRMNYDGAIDQSRTAAATVELYESPQHGRFLSITLPSGKEQRLLYK